MLRKLAIKCLTSSVQEYNRTNGDIPQRHILRDRRPGMTAYPACWATGTNQLKKCTIHGPTRAARQDKNILYRHDKPIEPTKDGPRLCVLYICRGLSRGHPSLGSLVYPHYYTDDRQTWLLNISKGKEKVHQRRSTVLPIIFIL